jgi:hypothetical protein
MKKMFAVGATAALMLAASSPAFAQGFNDDGLIVNDSGNTDVQFVDASQFQFALQAQFGDANAVGDENTAEVASEQGITQNQANAGLGEIDDLNQGGNDVGDFFFVD